jgi:hypothetical protein
MKKILPYCLLLSLSLLITTAHAQTCSREIAAFDAAPGGFSISGTAVLLLAGDSMTLSFDTAFGTQSGPDLHVYLALNFDAPTAAGNTNVDLGQLVANPGANTFSVPAGVGLNDYNYVLIHCKSFNHWWGGGLLGEVNCLSATNDPNADLSVTLYPNPATAQFSIQLTGENPLRSDAVVNIMDDRGVILKDLKMKSDETNLSWNVSGLSPGIYFVQFLSEGSPPVIRKMLVIQ